MAREGFSVVVAMYNVARYLPEFFESLEGQKGGMDNLDVILVNDGSTDESGDLAEAWAESHPKSVRVFHKENGGQSSARNLGLEFARNEWVCFADPDDFFDLNYFDEIEAFMGRKSIQRVALVAAHHVYYEEDLGRIRDGHPLRKRFEGGSRLVDLRGFANFIHLHVNSAFFRRSRIVEFGLQFSDLVRPTFEDGHFIAKYLLQSPEPILGLAAAAKYYYRRRADGSSAVQTSHGDARRYTDVPRYGHLDVLELANGLHGEVPHWLQNTVLYELFWFMKNDQAIFSNTASIADETFDEFHQLVKLIRQYVTDEAIYAFDVMPVPYWMREVLLHGYSDTDFVSEDAVLQDYDEKRGLAALRYTYTGEMPQEEIRIRGRIVDARHSKTRSITFFRKRVLFERILWVSAEGTCQLRLNGRLVRIKYWEHSRTEMSLRSSKYVEIHRKAIAGVPQRFRKTEITLSQHFQSLLDNKWRRIKWKSSSRYQADMWTSLLLKLKFVKQKYGRAWVMIDRDTEANDSAEQLYRWLAKNRPEINSWFAVRRDSPDWQRLKKQGVKVAAYGSLQWKILMLMADHVASSHIDEFVVRPLDRKRYGPPQWRLTFLQHGVIKGDLSRWLNPKKPDLFITSTAAEYESIAGEGSPYRFSSKEVRLTGLPRHDALLEKRQRVARPSFLLISPTWRHYLVGKPMESSNVREKRTDFLSSVYAEQFTMLLRSPKLKEIADANDLDIVFMPHPNMQPYLDDFDLPDYLIVKRYGVDDVQDVMANTAVLVTDYSSMAFNLAYLMTPTVYFQFDREDFYSGSHSERPGYFDYERDGFGPVVESLDEVIRHVDGLVSGASSEEYRQRMEKTFPVRDGLNTQRVFEAMLELDRPLAFEEARIAYTPRPLGTQPLKRKPSSYAPAKRYESVKPGRSARSFFLTKGRRAAQKLRRVRSRLGGMTPVLVQGISRQFRKATK